MNVLFWINIILESANTILFLSYSISRLLRRNILIDMTHIISKSTCLFIVWFDFLNIILYSMYYLAFISLHQGEPSNIEIYWIVFAIICIKYIVYLRRNLIIYISNHIYFFQYISEDKKRFFHCITKEVNKILEIKITLLFICKQHSNNFVWFSSLLHVSSVISFW